jgi:hypothetical protein
MKGVSIMDWITKEYVAEQAKLGEIPALECSLLHHQQGRDADWVELKEAIKKGKFTIKDELCSCCQAVGNFKGSGKATQKACPECPLFVSPYQPDNSHCCGGTWTDLAMWYTYEALTGDYSNANFKAFQEAEAKVCTYIERVLEQKRAEAKKEKKKKCLCSDCEHIDTILSQEPCSSCQNAPSKKSAPQLRHGDYGRCWNERNGARRVFIKNKGDGLVAANEYGTCIDADEVEGYKDNYIILGNIFDDLARNAEDLERFRAKSTYDSRYPGSVEFIKCMGSNDGFNIYTEGGCTFNTADLVEIHQKLGRLIATAKRRKGAKK